MAAPVDLVEVSEAGVYRLNPAARGSKDLTGERREADGNRDCRRRLAGHTGCGLAGLPVPPRGGGPGARQPVQRDVVDDALPVRLPTGSPPTNAREIL